MYWYKVRDGLIQEFGKWCGEVHCEMNIHNFAEYLGAMDYLKMKKVVDAIKTEDITLFSRFEPYREMLKEGFLPYNAICNGRKKK